MAVAQKIRRFYAVAILFLLAGGVWALFNVLFQFNYSVCVVKNLTGLPCPSCGTTGAVSDIVNGNLAAALHKNPLGYLVLPMLIVLPFWLLADLLKTKNSLYYTYYKLEANLKKRPALLTLLLSPIMIIWIWKLQTT